MIPVPDCVKVLVLIKKNSTNELKSFITDINLINGKPSIFMWEEGDYACDCNRTLFFGEKQEDCSSGNYSVKIFLSDKCIYSEFEIGDLNDS